MVDFFNLLNLGINISNDDPKTPTLIDTDKINNLLYQIFHPATIIITSISAFVCGIFFIRNWILIHHCKDPAQRNHILFAIAWQGIALVACIVTPILISLLWTAAGGKDDPTKGPKKLSQLTYSLFLPILKTNIPTIIIPPIMP